MPSIFMDLMDDVEDRTLFFLESLQVFMHEKGGFHNISSSNNVKKCGLSQHSRRCSVSLSLSLCVTSWDERNAGNFEEV